MITCHVPSFSATAASKVNKLIAVPSPHHLVRLASATHVPAIAEEPIPASVDGTHIFVTCIDDFAGFASINVGFTSTGNFDSDIELPTSPGWGQLNGVCLYLNDGDLHGGTGDQYDKWDRAYFSLGTVSKVAVEVISVLTISDNGATRSVQFIVDGHDGPVYQCARTDFENRNGGSEIFPVVTLGRVNQAVHIIPFDQVKSKSPRIQELIHQVNSMRKKNNDDDDEVRRLPSEAQSLQLLQQEFAEYKKFAEAQIKQKDEQIEQQSTEIAILKKQIEELKREVEKQ